MPRRIAQDPAVCIPAEGTDAAHPGQGAGSVTDFGGFSLSSEGTEREHHDRVFKGTVVSVSYAVTCGPRQEASALHPQLELWFLGTAC
ncbi:hypothetical protein ROHU_030339 [Labeo rohita]|uniref:Uncharacterized protein n=1 Tax=Labeo rohita TaxID=84645 RepID=A0A498LS99_LABRO|nr:hypothetical protein ROHU_030339 [Labeo rohita]